MPYFQVCFTDSDGTENLDPRPPFRIRLPKMLKSNTHALPGNKKSTTENDVSMTNGDSEKEKLIVEAYTPPDPGPYPQDQPRQNSVRFTPIQVLCNPFYKHTKCYFLFIVCVLRIFN